MEDICNNKLEIGDLIFVAHNNYIEISIFVKTSPKGYLNHLPITETSLDWFDKSKKHRWLRCSSSSYCRERIKGNIETLSDKEKEIYLQLKAKLES